MMDLLGTIGELTNVLPSGAIRLRYLGYLSFSVEYSSGEKLGQCDESNTK